MSESPEPPPKKSTSGRIISAIKRKLTMPISTFVKAVHPKKKVKVIKSSDVASLVQETGTASLVQEQQSTLPVTSHHGIIISDEDEDESSHHGQTLDHNSNVLMISDEEEITAEKELGKWQHIVRLDTYQEYIWPACLSKEWTTGVYGFFKPDPIIEYVSGRRAHTFICAATHCTQNVHHFLDTRDAKSTSNLWRHAVKCWGEENVDASCWWNPWGNKRCLTIWINNGCIWT